MPDQFDVTNELVGLIYETAQEPNLWPILLEGLTAATQEDDDVQLAFENKQLVNEGSHHYFRRFEAAHRDINEYSELTQTLIPHFQRALKINQQFATLQEERDSVASILEELPLGILLVKEDGTILNMNSFARQLLEAENILAIENDRLVCMDSFSKKKLQTMITQATAEDEQEANTFSVKNADNKNVYSMYVSPARSGIIESIKGNICSIFIATAEATKTLSSLGLKEVYGLSPAEIRIAQHLVNGKTIDEAVTEFNISLNTVKTQLKSVFAKTGTTRQAELVSELLSNPALVVKNHNHEQAGQVQENNSAKLNKPYLDTQVVLRDGRVISYTEFGDANGMPVLFFHNLLSSRYQAPVDNAVLKELNIRLIAPDRQGVGGSTYLPGRNLQTWAEDMSEFTRILGIDKYYVIGHSTGGPHVAACAYYNPQQCIRAGLISSMAPFKNVVDLHWMRASDKLLMGMARHTPSLLMPFLKAMSKSLVKSPKNFIERYTSNWFEGDLELLRQGTFLDDWASSLQEGISQGTEGMVEEIFLMARPWGFELADIKVETFVWHGTDDNSVDLSFANKFSEIPSSRFTSYPDEGHLIILRHSKDIFSELVQD